MKPRHEWASTPSRQTPVADPSFDRVDAAARRQKSQAQARSDGAVAVEEEDSASSRQRRETVRPAEQRPRIVAHDGLAVEDDVVDVDIADVLLEEGAVITIKVVSWSRMKPAPPKFPMKYPRLQLECVDVESGEIVYAYADLVAPLRPTHKFYRWWTMALGHKPKRADRPPRLGIFVGKQFRATVRTVRRNWDGQALPGEHLHSRVDLLALTALTSATQEPEPSRAAA